jgi:hypothetical protein
MSMYFSPDEATIRDFEIEGSARWSQRLSPPPSTPGRDEHLPDA